MKANNYDGEEVSWAIGQGVIMVDDTGREFFGETIDLDYAFKLINIKFDDGEEGWERTISCYHK